jgi:hypothetical protein
MKTQDKSEKSHRSYYEIIRRTDISYLLETIPIVKLENNLNILNFTVNPSNMQPVNGYEARVTPTSCWRVPRPDAKGGSVDPNGLISINANRSCGDTSDDELWYDRADIGFLCGFYAPQRRAKVSIRPLWNIIESTVSLRTSDELGFSSCYADVAHYSYSSIVQKIGDKWSTIANFHEQINRYTTSNTDFKGRPKTISNSAYATVCESPIVEAGAFLGLYATMQGVFNIILDDVSIESKLVVKAKLISVDINFS